MWRKGNSVGGNVTSTATMRNNTDFEGDGIGEGKTKRAGERRTQAKSKQMPSSVYIHISRLARTQANPEVGNF